MRSTLALPMTFLAGVAVAIMASWVPSAISHAQAPAPGAFMGQGFSFGDFGGRPVQIFRLDEADGPYTVPEGKALIVTQLSGTLGQPSAQGRIIKLQFDTAEVWRVSSDNIGFGWYSNGIMIPGLQAGTGTTVSIETLNTGGTQPGVILGYLVG